VVTSMGYGYAYMECTEGSKRRFYRLSEDAPKSVEIEVAVSSLTVLQHG